MTDTLERLRQSLADRYTVERELGSGGMALVFLARDLKHDRPVAIKVLRPELAAALGPERFLREIRLSAQLHHPHILPLYDSGEALPDPARGGDAGGGILYYVMPLVEGETLRDRIARETQLPLDDALQITREVADALSYAHSRDVVHRDIKPENILLESGHAVVADFGIARAITAAGGASLTETGLAVGTPSYMSPEQASGEQRLDGRSDVYSLGCVLYEMLAGEPPYTGPTAQAIIARRMTDPVPPLRTVRETVPAPVEQAINRALARVPADRFATAGQFIEALSGAAPAARPTDRRARVSPRALRRAAMVTVAVAVLAVAVYGVARARRPAVNPSAAVIAVLPFTSSAPDTTLARLGSDLMMAVSSTLNGVGGVEAVDRYEILSAAGGTKPLSPDQAAAIGRRFGAGSFVQGSLVRDAAGVRLDLGIYRTDTHVPLGSVIVVRASPDSLFALSDSITLALLRQVWLRGTPPSANLEDVTTQSVSALREFLEGERLAVAGHWSEAADAFLRAAKADTTFWVASWRYHQALGWQGKDDDDPRLLTYANHLSAFEPRDRIIIQAENSNQSESFEAHLNRFRALAEQYPDDWVVAMNYGDHLVHGAPRAGHTKAEARKWLLQAVSLNPALIDGWGHLFVNSLGQDSSAARLALDGWSHLGGVREQSAREGWDAAQGFRLAMQLQSSGGRPDGPLLDSVARAVVASDSGGAHGWAAYFLVFCGFPAAEIALNRRILQMSPHGRFTMLHVDGSAMSWAARGAWDSAVVALAANAVAYPERPLALRAYQVAAVGAWLGQLDASVAGAQRAAAVQFADRQPAGPGSAAARAAIAWADGVLAVHRSDLAALSAARETIRRTEATQAAFLDRSLGALGLTLGHSVRVAAESLAVIDERATEGQTYTHDAYAVSVNHMAAADALLAVGDTARAIRSLYWHEAGFPPPGGGGPLDQLFAGLAYLKLAQIEDAQGRRDLARGHYEQFLRRYDSPNPPHQHLVTEARAALQRLGG